RHRRPGRTVAVRRRGRAGGREPLAGQGSYGRRVRFGPDGSGRDPRGAGPRAHRPRGRIRCGVRRLAAHRVHRPAVDDGPPAGTRDVGRGGTGPGRRDPRRPRPALGVHLPPRTRGPRLDRSGPGMTSRQWWRDAVIYQVYPRSFADSDGDGIGDLPGISARLPYLADLGVDAVWLSPFFRSPMIDGGYDVSDYRDVDPMFGTLADFDAMVNEAHRLGIRVIVDLVPNHTSSAHPWFVEALADSRQRDRYVYRG